MYAQQKDIPTSEHDAHGRVKTTRRMDGLRMNTTVPAAIILNDPSGTGHDVDIDDYDYQDLGLSPEVRLTTNHQQRNIDAAVNDDIPSRTAEEKAAQADEDFNLIFERPAGARRAQLPDLGYNGPQLMPQPTFKHANPERGRRFPRLVRRVLSEHVPEENHEITMNVISLDCYKDGDTNYFRTRDIDSRGFDNQFSESVIWRHCHRQYLHLEEFKQILSKKKPPKFSESDEKLTNRLLRRVETFERRFVETSFLHPTVLRYGSQDQAKRAADKTCSFINFPFFALINRSEVARRSKSQRDHPLRSLLKYHFRLSKAVDRDRRQSVNYLSNFTLARCLEEEDVKEPVRGALTSRDAAIYVPQLWGLLLGPANLVTSSYFHVDTLLGASNTLEPLATPGLHAEHLVKICYNQMGTVHDIVYPLSQCDSWFVSELQDPNAHSNANITLVKGLLNKQREILNLLNVKHEEGTAANYKIYRQDKVVDRPLWHRILRNREKGEVLELWIKNTSSTVRDDNSSQNSKSTGSTYVSKSTQTQAKPVATRRASTGAQLNIPIFDVQGMATFHPLDVPENAVESNPPKSRYVPQVVLDLDSVLDHCILPFLAWSVVDDIGQEDDSVETGIRVDRFLQGICRDLTARLREDSDLDVGITATADARTSALHQTAVSRDVFQIIGRTWEKVSEKFSENNALSPDSKQVEQENLLQTLLQTTRTLLLLFIPERFVDDSRTSKFVWGALYTVITVTRSKRLPNSDVEFLISKLSNLIQHAETLHLGVLRQHPSWPDPSWGVRETSISDAALVLIVICFALSEIMNLFVELARLVGNLPNTEASESRLKPSKKLETSSSSAERHLKDAKNFLIAESDRLIVKNELGPCTTPETLFIALLKRVSHGVRGKKNFDIIRIYDENLQILALDVKKRASRRLQFRLTEAKEEISIIKEIFTQQRTALRKFRKILEPETYTNPNTAARLQYKYYSKTIDDMSDEIQGRVHDCTELLERANQLANENVQIVETLQDDNNKALFIFTLITILFLPPSFVAGFFGMNLVGINGTAKTTYHFWIIAGPLTAGIMVVSILVAFKGEYVFQKVTRLAEFITTPFRLAGSRIQPI